MCRLLVYTLFYTGLEHVFNLRIFPREDGTDVEQRRTQQRGINGSVRKAQVRHTDDVEEDGYDDVWPPRISNSTLRYQDLADVRTEVGRVPADVRVLASQHTSRVGSRSTIPPRSRATQTQLPVVPIAQRRQSMPVHDDEIAERHSDQLVLGRSRPRIHWTVFVGMAMITMLLGWIVLTMLANWWQVTQDDWHYGRPRTYQVDMVVGHSDSAANPSHFVALNLRSHIQVIEFPGGDSSKAKVYVGPTLIGPGQDLAVVTLTFKDVNGDGKLDMIVNVQGSHFVFINDSGQFRPARPNENVQQ